MASSSSSSSSSLLPTLLLLSFLLATTTTSNALDAAIFQAYKTKHTHFPSSQLEALVLLSRNDPSRLSYLTSLRRARSDVPVASGHRVVHSSSYVVRVSLGTPPQTLFMVLDTSSDLSLVPSFSSFSPSNSTTYCTLPRSSPLCPSRSSRRHSFCTFSRSYGSDSFAASLASDTLTLSTRCLPNFAFASVSSISGPGTSFPKQGLLALGRGPASLPSQAQPLLGDVFSYCLPSFTSYYFTGSLRLGAARQPRHIHYTPLLRNPHRSSLYYVNLTGISVGRTLLQVPAECFAFNPSTGAGTIVDTGTVISRFVRPVYAALRDEFRRQVGAAKYTSLGAFDTCFATTPGGPATPSVTLHMDGGLHLPLPKENTLIHSSGRPLACLAMAESPGNVNQVLNVVAALQQQNHRVVIDVARGCVGFSRELCN